MGRLRLVRGLFLGPQLLSHARIPLAGSSTAGLLQNLPAITLDMASDAGGLPQQIGDREAQTPESISADLLRKKLREVLGGKGFEPHLSGRGSCPSGAEVGLRGRWP